jgi:hypothetical protein
MTNSSYKARIVRVRYEADESGLFFAVSPDLKGFLVAKPSLEEARREVPIEIKKLYLASDMHVIVTEVEGDSPNGESAWVAIPAAAAERELATTR